MTDAAPSSPEGSAPEAPKLSTSPASTSSWGRRATIVYLVACALALVAMLVETVLGHPGTGSMFAAILAVPWSMLVAGFAPPLPRDWPMAAGLAVRMIPLALFMLLNAAIIRGIAARSERDLARTATRVSLLLLLAAPLGSGCILSTRQEVFVAAPTRELVFFNGGNGAIWAEFDLSTSPQWRDQHGKLARISDLAIVGDFSNGPSGSGLVPMDVKIDLAPDTVVTLPSGSDIWGPVHLAAGEQRRIDWPESERLITNASALEREIRGDGEFALVTSPVGVEVRNLRLMAVFELK